MSWVDLQKYASKKITLTTRDLSYQGRGFIVRKHALAWIWYLLVVAAWTVGVFGGLVALHVVGVLAPLPAFWTRVALIFAILFVAKIAILRYRITALEFLLITPDTVFCSEVQHWFVQVVDPIELSSINRLDTDEQSAWLPGVRIVRLNTAGDDADKTMTFTGGGDRITAAWQILRQRRRR